MNEEYIEESDHEEDPRPLTEEELELDFALDQMINAGIEENHDEDEGLEHIKICSIGGECYDERESDYPDCCQNHGDKRELEIARREAEERAEKHKQQSKE